MRMGRERDDVAKVTWVNGSLVVTCPCGKKEPGGVYLAAHVLEFNRDGGTFICKCGRTSKLGHIPDAPKAVRK